MDLLSHWDEILVQISIHIGGWIMHMTESYLGQLMTKHGVMMMSVFLCVS
jgi:hypothetical protein